MNPDVELRGEPVMVAWASEPLAGNGCYSAFDNASMNRMPALSRPHGRVAFAGEHTNGLDTGTMEAAAESGERAAGEALELLGRG